MLQPRRRSVAVVTAPVEQAGADEGLDLAVAKHAQRGDLGVGECDGAVHQAW